MYKTLVIVFLLLSNNTHSAERKNIFADPQNLKILPEDISPEQLRDTMKSFALGLGLRCNDCHVGEEGKPLSTFEFDKDDKKLKKKARVMLKMLANINQQQLTKLDKIEKSPRIEVQCVTCHRGQQKPELIQTVLAKELTEKGIESMLDKYVSLRNEYYGGHTFDFSENVLPMFASNSLKGKEYINDAVKLLEKNAEYFPESFFGAFSLGAAYQQAGNIEKAKEFYNKALEINPEANFIKMKLKQLIKPN